MTRQQELEAIERHVATKGVTRIDDTVASLPPGHVEIWTDGSCFTVSRRGGWGAILICNGQTREICGGQHDTTNNRMEITAAIRALEALKRPACVRLYSDSRYLISGATRWLRSWKRRRWTKRDGNQVINIDLWMRLDIAMQPHNIDWRWVRGHSGTAMNERADQLAAQGAASAGNS